MNPSRHASIAVLSLLVLSFLSAPAVAEAGDDNVEMEEVVLIEDESEDETEVLLEYETSLSVRIGVFLFGSEVLEEDLLDAVGIEGTEAEFLSLDSESAEIVYSGGPGGVSYEGDLAQAGSGR